MDDFLSSVQCDELEEIDNLSPKEENGRVGMVTRCAGCGEKFPNTDMTSIAMSINLCAVCLEDYEQNLSNETGWGDPGEEKLYDEHDSDSAN